MADADGYGPRRATARDADRWGGAEPPRINLRGGDWTSARDRSARHTPRGLTAGVGRPEHWCEYLLRCVRWRSAAPMLGRAAAHRPGVAMISREPTRPHASCPYPVRSVSVTRRLPRPDARGRSVARQVRP